MGGLGGKVWSACEELKDSSMVYRVPFHSNKGQGFTAPAGRDHRVGP